MNIFYTNTGMKPWLEHKRELSFQLWISLLFLLFFFFFNDLLIKLLVVVEKAKHFTKNLVS